jgi:FkbM family methyltransferase
MQGFSRVFKQPRHKPGVYWGQKGEDRHIHKTYFPTLQNGTFLEMGALDGITYSNTKFFEDTLNWSGVLIEPIPSKFAALRSNRPRCSLFQCAVSTKEGAVDIYEHGAVSSVRENTTEAFYNAWHREKNIQIIQVPARRLDSILHEAGVKKIDFWSLDVEGSELDALQTMDWSIPVRLICIEKQTNEKKETCESILIANGFTKSEDFEHNEIWIGRHFRK